MKFLKNHFFLHDMLNEDLPSWARTNNGIGTTYYDVISNGEDNKGKYEIRQYFEKWYCNCHPESCSHNDGLTYRLKETKKTYL